MNFLFDLYGTLIDIKTDEGGRVFWRKVCAMLGQPRLFWRSVRREYLSLCAARYTSAQREFDLLGVFEDMLSSRGRAREDATELALSFRRASTEKLRLFPEVCEMLTALREAGAGVYLLSNAQSCFTRAELDALGLTSLFDGIIISSEVGVKKPSADIFRIAFERFGLSPEECIYVGNDMRDDVLGATGAGIRSVYIPTEQSGKYDDPLPEPTHRVRDHAELAELLLSLV